MPLPAPIPARNRLWSDFEQMLVTGAAFPILMALLLVSFFSPFRVAMAATAMLGLWLCLVALLFAARGPWAARHWQRVRLKTIHAGIGTEPMVMDSRLAERYFPRLRYEYTFGGKPYTGSCYHLDAGSDTSFDLNEVQESVRRANRATRVYVNPRDPSESCLSVEQGSGVLGRYVCVFLIGTLLASLGLAASIAG